MGGARFWLVWSLRDLRRRWVQVVAISLVIAIGVAVFAGLGGMRHFRETSASASFAALKFHDVRVSLADGDYADEGALAEAVDASGVDVVASEERLLVRTQIDAEPVGEDVLTPGLIVGVPLDRPREVDQIRAIRGSGLDPGDRAAAVIDRSYANFYKLPDTGTLKLAGGVDLKYVGQGQSPQYFLITSDTGFGGESTLGVLYTPLEFAQGYADKPGEVNELVLRLPPGADQARAVEQIEAAVAKSFPSAETKAGSDEQVSTILFRDAKNDQRMLSFFGLLVLLGAAIATFNLVSRTVEAERREIGVGLALGVPTGKLALRPLLLGVEIALIGSIFGIALSWVIAEAFASALKQFLPMPVYTDPFTFKVFVRGAIVGMLLPVVATIWPVWRAVRVQPVEAIRVSSRAAEGGAVRAASRVKLPGGTVSQMPWRNALRTPRRTLLAVVGIGAVLGAMIALIGIVDSYNQTIERSLTESTGDAPGRLNVVLTDFQARTSPAVRSVEQTSGVSDSTARLDLGAEISSKSKPGESFPVLLSLAPFEGAVWRPTLEEGALPESGDEIVLAAKAADDLGVSVGDSVSLQVPGRSGGALDARTIELTLSGLTSDPFRVFSYASDQVARDLGYDDYVNALSVMPEPGVSDGVLQRRLAANPAVALARPVTADTDALKDTIDQFSAIIQVAALAVLLLAVLMAFNLASISLDERRREYATMFAFGLPVRRGLRIAATENLIVGVLGTVLGALIGMLAIGWIINSLVGETWPEIGIVPHISMSTVAIALLTGVVAVALTPYVMARRLTRMDIPSTLRVVE